MGRRAINDLRFKDCCAFIIFAFVDSILICLYPLVDMRIRNFFYRQYYSTNSTISPGTKFAHCT